MMKFDNRGLEDSFFVVKNRSNQLKVMKWSELYCVVLQFNHKTSFHILLNSSCQLKLFYFVTHKLKNTSSHQSNKKSVVLVDTLILGRFYPQEQTELLYHHTKTMVTKITDYHSGLMWTTLPTLQG